MSGNADLVLHNVSFDTTSGRWLHEPARFTGEGGSYAEISDGVQIPESFSWIGALNRKDSSSRTLSQWDVWAAEIWLMPHGLFVVAYCEDLKMGVVTHGQTIENDKWYVIAVSYSNDTQNLSVWVDGDKQEETIECTRLARADNNNVLGAERYV